MAGLLVCLLWAIVWAIVALAVIEIIIRILATAGLVLAANMAGLLRLVAALVALIYVISCLSGHAPGPLVIEP